MPLAVTTRLLETHDVLMLLVPLMEKAPWVRKNKINGNIEKFEDHQWERVEADDEGRLPKLQTQVWLAIYNLVMDQECRTRYELTSIRRENLLRLRRYINEVVVDQLPPLTNLHRTLEEMSISGQFTGADSTSVTASPFVVELVAEARETLVRTYEGRWQEVADLQMKEVFVKETPEELKRLANMISIPKEMFEEPLQLFWCFFNEHFFHLQVSNLLPSPLISAHQSLTRLCDKFHHKRRSCNTSTISTGELSRDRHFLQGSMEVGQRW